ncbi:hypothetical protein AWM79_19110 [Pseudomonas agarici]|uniref:Uncharacterized protein n=1 Tax=Pseudomonas agarici TaxID=46677 RepID=A0A0X1T5D9_PSEAA|nr:hypothetical protein [Pseudomonas agarici]AMB87287.1 hypothetical protein AWM79_19110 [Pseudomonas agarici]NWB94097.1 hypothetical protein [Pseudomonas agarici]NWC11850.1 hypothetical protein [Pseudomonas agarici]SEL01458.1 hypothetical protein SAMN05216604_109167 [Pseudomonas agarici]
MRRSVFSLFGLLSLFGATPFACAAGENYGVLIISRERLEVSTSCEIGVYLHDQLSARLFQERATSFNLPPGNISVRLKTLPSQVPGCAASMLATSEQLIRLRGGEVRKFAIVDEPNGLRLKPVPLGYQ